MNELGLKSKIAKIFVSNEKKPKSRTLFHDQHGKINLLLEKSPTTCFGILRIYGGIDFVYEYVFSIKNEAGILKKHEGIVFDKLVEYLSKLKLEMKHMNELGFEILGYGSYGYEGLRFLHNGRFGIEVEYKKERKQLLKDKHHLVYDMNIAILTYGRDFDQFMNLPSKARDLVLRSEKLEGYELV